MMIPAFCKTVMNSWPKILSTLTPILLKILAVVISVGFFLVFADEAVETYRGWTNKDGVIVHGYGLWEAEITSKRALETMPDVFKYRQPGRELLGFYQYEFLCRWQLSFKQRDWGKEREGKLKVKMYAREDSPNLYTEEELPMIRYECIPTEMLYRAGMGWGLF
jgi:hypothetical protein